MTYPTQTESFKSSMSEQTPPQMLEQRIIDLLYTFCESSTKNQDALVTLTADAPEAPSQNEKQALNVLARKSLRLNIFWSPQLTGWTLENLAFLIRDQDAKYGRKIGADDIFVTMLNWGAYKNGLDDGTLAMMVRTMKTTKILQIRVTPTENILEKLGREVNKMLLRTSMRA
jgi:hypothetical protein